MLLRARNTSRVLSLDSRVHEQGTCRRVQRVYDPDRSPQSFRTAGCSGTGQPEVAGYVLTAVAPMRANVPGKIMAALA